MYIAPRGLIAVLLLLSILLSQNLFIFNISLIIQVVLFSSLVLLIGIVSSKNENLKTNLAT
jgi:potassium/hydrogen antiporter